MARVASQTIAMVAPMIPKSAVPRPPSSLKCDIWPRAAWPTMMTISSTRPATITQPVRRIVRTLSWPSIQASAREYSAMEIENFRGLDQSGAPSTSVVEHGEPGRDERERGHAEGEPEEGGDGPGGRRRGWYASGP